LWHHPRIVLTAHTAAGGSGRYQRAADLFFANLYRFVAGEPLLHEVTAGPGPTTRSDRDTRELG
jgi:phosphoglycerate dehydrogenase-like enzyme